MGVDLRLACERTGCSLVTGCRMPYSTPLQPRTSLPSVSPHGGTWRWLSWLPSGAGCSNRSSPTGLSDYEIQIPQMLVKVLIRDLLVVSELVGLLLLRACCVFVLPRATSAPILHCVLTPTNLSGSIPKSLTAITMLQVLDMSNNNFFWRSSGIWFVFFIHPYQFCEQP